MQVILAGPSSARGRVREQLVRAGIEVVAEVATLAEARRVSRPSDAVVLAERGDPEGVSPEALTSREIEVLELLAEGLANKAIAARLRISDQTVKFHLSSIAGKLGAKNRTDTVRLAVRRGLVTL
jgi:DNA-binding NarL/FixJ family response regulator